MIGLRQLGGLSFHHLPSARLLHPNRSQVDVVGNFGRREHHIVIRDYDVSILPDLRGFNRDGRVLDPARVMPFRTSALVSRAPLEWK